MTLLSIWLFCVSGALLISTIALAVRLHQSAKDSQQWEDSSHEHLRLLEDAQDGYARLENAYNILLAEVKPVTVEK